MIQVLESWVSASATRNWCHADPLLDWLDLYGPANGFTPDNLYPDYDPATDMSLFQREKGRAFEEAVMRCIESKFEVVQIGGSAFDSVSEARTLQAMRQGAEIIYKPLLLDTERRVYARPDLLVRSDVLNRLVAQPCVAPEEALMPAPDLDAPHHYRIVDIKFTTLGLAANGYLGNDASDRRRKVQLLIGNRALGQLQGFEPWTAYVIGRSWKKGNDRGNSCFDLLGPAAMRDADVVLLADRAIEWAHRVREEGSNWNVLPTPSVPELYPHMTNTYDSPWHQAKREIGEALSELTMLWYVTPKNRPAAHSAGIYRMDDSRCDSTLFGLSINLSAKLQKIIEANKPANEIPVRPESITCDQEWRNPAPLAFYVDFETVNDLDDDFSEIPQRGGQSLIFMIGCGHVEHGRWVFKVFTCDRLTEGCEAEMIEAWHAHMEDVKMRLWSNGNPLLFHWSHAETSTMVTAYNSAQKRHGREWPELNWYDFLGKVVKAEPVTVKGALAFGLKAVAKAMHRHGLIQTEWTNGPGDGLEAMLGAWRCDAKAKATKGSMRDLPLMKGIETYNEVDCKVMQEIVAYLRLNH